MKQQDSLLEILRRLAVAGCIDAKIFIPGADGRTLEVHAHAPTPNSGTRRRRPRHLRSVA